MGRWEGVERRSKTKDLEKHAASTRYGHLILIFARRRALNGLIMQSGKVTNPSWCSERNKTLEEHLTVSFEYLRKKYFPRVTSQCCKNWCFSAHSDWMRLDWTSMEVTFSRIVLIWPNRSREFRRHDGKWHYCFMGPLPRNSKTFLGICAGLAASLGRHLGPWVIFVFLDVLANQNKSIINDVAIIKAAMVGSS